MAKKYVLGPNAARKIAEILRGSGEVSRRRGAAPSLAFDSEYVAPFSVQWAQSANDGEGAWIIWLPSDDLVTIPEGSLDPSADLDDVGGDYPPGWYILTGEQLDADEGGTLYLNVSIGGASAAFSDAPAAASGDEFDIPICTASVNSSTGERKVRQFVTSAIVVGGGDGGDENVYGCDERSISLIEDESGDTIRHGNLFFIQGFGKFSVQGKLAPYGTYVAPGSSAIELDGEETDFAVLCRTGNSSAADANFLTYKKLRVSGAAGSSPFKYVKSTGEDPDTHQPVTLHKLENCKFYWNGSIVELPDFDVSGLLGGGSVYLRGTQAAPTAQSPDPTWTWTLGTAPQQAPSNGKVLNYKLYDFAQSKVAVDYRTTFLALEDHTQKAKVTVAKPGSSSSIVLDTTGSSPKLVISDGTNTVSIDLADVPNGCGGSFGIHELSFKGADGETKKYHGLFCDNIDLSDMGKLIKDVDITPSTTETVVTFIYTDDSTSEIHIPHGQDGGQGPSGKDGDTPDITAEKAGGTTYIYADGDLIATIADGTTPTITAQKANGVTTIYVNGNAVAQISDGTDGAADLPDKDVITDVSFSISGGQLVATLAKENLKTGATSQATKTICAVGELDVVTEESYSTSTHQFTNVRKRINVIGNPANAQGQAPFTATPLSGE